MRQRIAVLGIGNLRVGPGIVGALATFFGEIPIEVSLYDPDPERLELFARFALVAFRFNKAPHDILVCEDPNDAVDNAIKAIVSLEEPAARKYLKSIQAIDVSTPISEAVESMLANLNPDSDVLDLTNELIIDSNRYRLPLPRELSEDELRALPHQILRWVRGEEYLHEFLADHERSPIRDWLERPESALLS